MSVATDAAVSQETSGWNRQIAGFDLFRLLALCSGLVLLGTSLSVLYFVTDVVGAVGWLLAVVAASLALATLVANLLGTRSAVAVAVVLLVGGLGAYLAVVPSVYLAVVTVSHILSDTLALLTGLSVLRMTAADTWALGVAPGPTFLTWYFSLRRRYVSAAVVGGATLGFFVLTGDAGPTVTLVGAVATAGLIGFGQLDRLGGSLKQLDALAVMLVAMVLVASLVSVVPGSGGVNPLAPSSGTAPTVEGSLLSAQEQVPIVGSIRLTPNVRFTVDSQRQSYWRVAAYDRYTGSGWVRSGGTRSMRGSLPPPTRAVDRVRQTFTAEAKIGTMPAAWKPIMVEEGIENVRVTDLGGLQPADPLSSGDSYTVISRLPDDDPETLKQAGADYPDAIREQYLQLPSSTSDRLTQKASSVTADAGTPYEKAVAVEDWLESNKAYSLSVERPSGDVAESFVFDMERGYCTYYATTMAAMLRTQGVPARFVVGYTPGQRVAEDKWVVRGLDSHAWVEVYFPDVGWVAFDPTPAAPRQDAEQTEITRARAANESNVDTQQSVHGTWTPTPTGSGGTNGSNSTIDQLPEDQLIQRLQPGGPGVVNRSELNATTSATQTTTTTTDDQEGTPLFPSRRTAFLVVLALLGGLSFGHYTGALGRTYRFFWLRWQGRRRSPEQDTERAFRRLEYLLSREFRERRPDETPREYLQALANVGMDDRAHRVGHLYERAAYAGSVSRAEAEEAIALVDDVVGERTGRLSGRLRGLRPGSG